MGIALADAVVRELAAVVARLQSDSGAGRGGALRWTGPESWHITLQFLGNATEEQLECLRARLGGVRAAPVPVRLGEVDCFDRAGVLFAGVTMTPELAALQQRVVDATSGCRFVAETRPFHPHITLARKTGTKGPSHPSERKPLAGDPGREQGTEKAHSKTLGQSAGGPETLRVLTSRAKAMAVFSSFTAREFVLYESHLGREGARYEVRARFGLGAG